MEFLAYLKSAAKSNSSVRTKFLQQYNNNDKALHVFYEGNDDPSFYSNYFEKKDTKIFYYQAENKKGVYEIHSKINWSSYNKKRALFFVDKDFSDILNELYSSDTNIFVTKYYSIENYLVCKPIFIRICRDLLHIDDELFITNCYKDFEKKLNQFSVDIIPLIAWIIYHRSISSKLNLSNFKLSDIFSIDNDLNVIKRKNCRGKKIQSYLLDKTKIAQPLNSWKSILFYCRKISRMHSYKYYLRGKYEIWFLVLYINKLIEVINMKRGKGQPKIKMQLNLSSENAVELLGPRLRKPIDISTFLKANK
jgi:hypothetical protein